MLRQYEEFLSKVITVGKTCLDHFVSVSKETLRKYLASSTPRQEILDRHSGNGVWTRPPSPHNCNWSILLALLVRSAIYHSEREKGANYLRIKECEMEERRCCDESWTGRKAKRHNSGSCERTHISFSKPSLFRIFRVVRWAAKCRSSHKIKTKWQQ